MMRIAVIATLLALGVPCYAAQQPASPTQPASAAQRQAQIDRIRDGLNSPDPTKRVVTLEQALASKDAVLRRIALSAALASSDSDLRSMALAAAVRSAGTFVVDVSRGTSVFKVPPSFEVRIKKFDILTGQFEASSALSWQSNDERPGAVDGDRLSFEVDTSRIQGYSTCSGVARLETASSILKGSLTCTYSYGSETFVMSIDVLR